MNKSMLIKLGVGLGLAYAGWKYGGMAQKTVIGTAMVAVGAAAVVRQVPVVNQYV